MRDIAIDRIMTTDPETIEPSAPVAAAKKMLESGDIHHLPVVENGLLQGIISSADLRIFDFLKTTATTLSDVPVRQIMEADPVVLESGASLRDAASKLATGGYHALPVVEPDRTLVGIVTTGDLIEHLLRQIPSGDGSIQAEATSGSAIHPGVSDISIALRNAEQAVECGEADELAQILLYFRDRNQLLQHACQAAEIYLRSGLGEHEHAVLVKCLADLEDSSDDADL
jgi:CBS domain-containing protein